MCSRTVICSCFRRRSKPVASYESFFQPKGRRMKKLEGKIALISGSGRGIGREIALKLASDGARIVVNDLDATFADDTVLAVRGVGSDAVACVGNVTDADFGKRFVASAVD